MLGWHLIALPVENTSAVSRRQSVEHLEQVRGRSVGSCQLSIRQVGLERFGQARVDSAGMQPRDHCLLVRPAELEAVVGFPLG